MSRGKVALIDGNSLLYRAFFALPTSLATSDGRITNAAYGFTSMLLRLLREERPAAVAVAFDMPGKTFRHEAYEDYKAHRPKTPDELALQIPMAKRVLESLGIPVLEVEGYEADDVLGTLARRLEAEDDVVVVTGDRDAFQLIDEHVTVMTTRKGISDIVLYDRDKVVERYGVQPEAMADFMGLKGDTSDNIPGVPGVGEKTAAQLIQRFSSIAGLYERIDEVESDKLKTRLIDNREAAELSRELATIHTEAPVEFDPAEARLGPWDLAAVEEVFRDLQFNTLYERFLQEQAAGQAPASADAAAAQQAAPARSEPADQEAVDAAGARRFVSGYAAEPPAGAPRHMGLPLLALAEARDGQEGTLDLGDGGAPVAVALAAAGRTVICEGDAVAAALDAAFGEASAGRLAIAGHDLKDAWGPRLAALPPDARLFDSAVAAYLVDPARSAYPLDVLSWELLGRRLAATGGATPALRAAERARACHDLALALAQRLEDDGLTACMDEIEMPLIGVLARMEQLGVGLDCDALTAFGEELTHEVGDLERSVYEQAGGEPFNINSPKQLGEVLFERLGLPKGKRTKTGYSTDASVLTKLAADFPIVSDILRYRELSKLSSTYVDALPRLIGDDGRLHTTFNQTVAATGRLSSADPNLQNIPVRTDLGRRLRDAFIPAEPGDLIMVADYSQIELRVLAHLSGDAALGEAFAGGLDIHRATAAEVFGVEPEDVTPEQRRKAKAVNFGLVYGQSAHGLAESLGISREEAQSYITLYFSRYPGVQDYIQQAIGRAAKDGFVTTVSGRRRYIPELRSSNHQLRAFGERTAVNSPIQGGAADIIKLAMIAIDERLPGSGLATRMVLQVHDELVFEVPPAERGPAEELVRREMEHAYELSIPLVVDVSAGPSWGEAK